MEMGLVRYQVNKTNGGASYHEWPAAEFVGRMAALVPPARKHVVRYYGALGPRSPLRSALTEATHGRATLAELEGGYSVTIAGKVSREVRKAASAAKRAWAACLRKIFEVDPVRCEKCGGSMKLVAVILDDRELDRILAHEGWPTKFPKARRYQDFRSSVCAGPEGSRPKAVPFQRQAEGTLPRHMARSSRAPPGSSERGRKAAKGTRAAKTGMGDRTFRASGRRSGPRKRAGRAIPGRDEKTEERRSGGENERPRRGRGSCKGGEGGCADRMKGIWAECALKIPTSLAQW